MDAKDKELPINNEPEFNGSKENLIKRLNNLISNQLFALCGTNKGYKVSNINVIERIEYWYNNILNNVNHRNSNIILPNINFIINYTYYVKHDRRELNNRVNKAFGISEDKDMVFDVVVGNPPFQNDNSIVGRQAKPLYDQFVEYGIQLSNRIISLITNNTFLTNDSKADLRKTMIRAGLRNLANYPISGEAFDGVGVSACIFLVDKNNTQKDFKYTRYEKGKMVNTYETKLKENDIIWESPYEISITQKLQSKSTMADIVKGDKLFGIASSGRRGFTGKGRYLDFRDGQFDDSILIKSKLRGILKDRYIALRDVPSGRDYIDKYKVICPHEISKSSLSAFSKAEILGPGHICTENWAIIAAFNNIKEAENLIKYMQTKAFRFPCYTFCSNAMTKLTKVILCHVPLQDFTLNSNINWNQSIPDIDRQLYKIYNLSQEEIDYIESTIKD